MKKIIILSFFLLICLRGFSQDIIITKEGKSIKTKIIELTDEKVSYKEYDYQEGTTNVLSLEQIKTIIWESGEVKDFNIEDVVEKADEAQPTLPYITSHKMRSITFSNGNYLSLSEFGEYLEINNMNRIREVYFSGVKLSQTGIGLLISGVVLSGGLGGIYIGLWQKSLSTDKLLQAVFYFTVGSGFVIASIPCLVVGSVKRNIAVDSYHRRINVKYSYQPTLNIGFTGNGLGITLNF
jgi:hypothetical protein